MPAYRYYIDDPLDQTHATLDGLEHRHLTRVMRQKEGELIELVNGKGKLAKATLEQIKKNESLLNLEHVDFFPLRYRLYLVQAEPSLTHLEFIAEKGTELGMSELILFKGDKSQSHLSESKLMRIKAKLIAALKQSGRVYLPQIKWKKKLEDLDLRVDFSCYGDLTPKASLLYERLHKQHSFESYAFYSGPESGFSQRELNIFKELQYSGVSLHSNILRTETAPLVFLSLMHSYLRLKGNLSIVN